MVKYGEIWINPSNYSTLGTLGHVLLYFKK